MAESVPYAWIEPGLFRPSSPSLLEGSLFQAIPTADRRSGRAIVVVAVEAPRKESDGSPWARQRFMAPVEGLLRAEGPGSQCSGEETAATVVEDIRLGYCGRPAFSQSMRSVAFHNS